MNSMIDCKAIVELNLDPIKVKLMHKESGEGWSRAQADAVEVQYRRFLYLMKIFPNAGAAPRNDVDIFWHYHILDTLKYAEDCENIFGYFLHHFPYVGLRGESDDDAHQTAGDRMRELYESTFHESYASADNDTAYSTDIPMNAISAAARTAYSTHVPRDAIWAKAARTAYSTDIPRDAIWAKAARTAYSTDVPRDAIAAQAGAGAASTQDSIAWARAFYAQRPVLAAA